MINTKTTRRTAPVVAAAALAFAASPAAGASAPGDDDTHCVIEVIGIHETGEFITNEPECFSTLNDSLRSIGVKVRASEPPLSIADVVEGDLLAQASAFTLGTHYDGFNQTASSIIVTGADCGGGYLNLSAAWVNRISSTVNGCTAVTFWDGFNKTGGAQLTGGGFHNLSSLNNAADSVSYGT